MCSNLIEVYDFYKKQYPLGVILFHLEGRYAAIFNDAKDLEQHDYPPVFSDEDIEIISSIGDKFEVNIIEYRNELGEYGFPDITTIKDEQQKDY